MLDTILINAIGLLGFLHLAAPIALHRTFRFAARCRPNLLTKTELPLAAAERILPVVPQLEALGFEFLGCFDFGEVSAFTRKIVGYCCNRDTNDFANLTVSCAPGATDSYLEFSTNFSKGRTLETNNNGVIPLTPDAKPAQVFRLPEIRGPRELYRLHRLLIEKHAGGDWAVPEIKGQEILRLVRTFENYGPRHGKLGYMKLSHDGESYELTWKGAALMAWRGMLPTVLLRQYLSRREMRAELRSLELRGVAALQKA